MSAPIRLRTFPLPLDWGEPISLRPYWVSNVQEAVDGSELRQRLASDEWITVSARVVGLSAAECEALRIFFQTLDVDEVLVPLPVTGDAQIDGGLAPAGTKVLRLNFIGSLSQNTTDVQITKPDGLTAIAEVIAWNQRSVSCHIAVWPQYRSPVNETGLPWDAPEGTTVTSFARGRFKEPPKISRETDSAFVAEVVFEMRRPRSGLYADDRIQIPVWVDIPDEAGDYVPPVKPPPPPHEPPPPAPGTPPIPPPFECRIFGKAPTFTGDLYTCDPTEAAFSVALGGDSQQYAIRYRCEAFFELTQHTGGTQIGPTVWKGGNTSGFDNFEQAKLTVSSPAETYYLNGLVLGGSTPAYPTPYDFEFEVATAGNATLTASMAGGTADPSGAAVGVVVMHGNQQYFKLTPVSIRLLNTTYPEDGGTESDWADDEPEPTP